MLFNPSSPASIPPTATYKELKNIKATWIHQARQQNIFKKYKLIAETLGKNIEETLPYPLNQGDIKEYKTVNQVYITLITHYGHYMPRARAYAWTKRLVITLGEPYLKYTQKIQVKENYVCTYTWSNDKNESDNAFILPGKWLATLEPLYNNASKNQRNKANIQAEAKRLSLLKKLQAGREI